MELAILWQGHVQGASQLAIGFSLAFAFAIAGNFSS